MSGHQSFQKNGLIVTAEQMIMCWVGTGSVCWGGNTGVGREKNQTRGGQQEDWGS